MAFPVTNSVVAGGGANVLAPTPNSTARTFHPLCRVIFVPSTFSSGRTLHVTSAKKQQQEFKSITGKFDSKNRRRSSPTTTTIKDDDEEGPTVETVGPESSKMKSRASTGTAAADDGYFLPELPGDKPDFWEGEQWDALGFFVQYLWAFGIGFALIACGIAAATYNEGATDFKDTPVYKEAIGSRELLDEQPDAGSDVFESNPTEDAPSLD